MHPETKRRLAKYSTVLGSMLVLLPNGVYWYWGNMAVYSLSYLAVVCQSTSGLDAPWVLSCFFIFWTLATMLSNVLASRINRRFTILIGAAITDIAIFCGFFAVQDSLLALTFTMGITMGIGTGLIDSSVLQLVVDWADGEDLGKLTACVQASLSLSAVLVNEFMTYVINPDNLAPIVNLGKKTKYFPQKSLLDRVPVSYLFLGCMAVGLHVSGFLLLREQPQDEKKALLQSGNMNSNLNNSLPDSKDSEREHGEKNKCAMEVSESLEETREPREEGGKHIKDFTPLETLKARSFHAIWLFVFLADVPFILVTNYYKLFGQLWIADDHFLTALGTTLVVICVFSSMLWGALLDKFGVKNCLVVFMTLLVVVQCWYYFTPMIDRWLFFFATLVYGCFAGSVFTCYTSATAILFGKTYFSTNFGLVMTANSAFNLVAPPLFHVILTHEGWYTLFIITSALSFLSIITLILLLPSF